MDDLEPVVEIDALDFTDTEKKLILQVIARDEDIRVQEKTRIEHLKDDLRNLREKGVPEGEEESYGRVCKRCRTPLGFILGTGALCPNCDKKVCKSCRVHLDKEEDTHAWLCTVCSKIRDIRAESGAWFYDGGNKGVKKKKVYGSFLVKKMFSKTRKRDTVIFKDPNWVDIIEDDDRIPEEDESYIMISTGVSGSYVTEEGIDKLSKETNKAVVGVSGEVPRYTRDQVITNTPDNISTQEAPLKLLALAHNVTDNDSCFGSEVTSPLHAHDDGSEMPNEVNTKDDSHLGHTEIEGDDNSHVMGTNDDHGIHSPGIYYRSESSTSEDESVHERENEIHEDDNHLSFVDHKEEEEEEEEEKEKDSCSLTDKHNVLDANTYVENELKDFINEIPSQVNDVRNVDVDEQVYEKVFRQKEVPVVVEKGDDFTQKIGFASMRKVTDQPVDVHVVQNDLDLQEFQRLFVRKKNIKFEKMRTDEQSDKDETDFSSSDSDTDVVIPQVVPIRKNSSDEEFEKLNEELNQNLNIQEVVIDEEIVLDKNYHKGRPSHNIEVKDNSSNLMFSNMAKLDSLSPTSTNDKVDSESHDNDDIQSFLISMSIPKKKKYEKARTEEHSDKEDSSSDESEDEIAVVPIRKNSSDEEFEKLNEELNQNLNIQEVVIDEEIVLDKNYHKGRPSHNIEVKDNSSNLMFSNMAKLDSLSPTSTNDKVDSESHDNDDIQSFLISMSIPKKKKYEKARTEEHSDKEDSSSDESEDEIAGSLTDKHNVLEANAKNEDELKDFISEIPSQVNDIRNVDVNEQVYEKVFRQKEVPVVVEKGDDFMQKFGFATMRKVTNQPAEVHVIQNDLDLQEFQRLFVRKKNIKFEKMRTDEQSDKDETDFSSSDSDTDVVIPQVVPIRKNSSDEEFEKLNEELNQNLNIQEVVIDEEIVLDKNYHKGRPSHNIEVKDNSSNLMFSNMAKLDSLSPTSTNDKVDSESHDNDDIQSFLISMSIPKKMKYEKARTEEHSDKEDSSSDESEDEIAGSLTDKHNVLEANAKNEDELKDFISEIPSQVNDIRNVDVNEQVYEKVFRQKEVPVVVEKGDDFMQKFGFATMRKVTNQPAEVHVIQNDLDLQEFQRLFVRKKNIKFEKMRTDEQSDKDETDFSSSDSDTDVVIPQVVPIRKNSSDEEFEKLNEELNQNLNIQEVVIDEEIVLDKNYHKGRPSHNIEVKDNSSNLMFSNMAKLDSLSPTSTNDNVDSESRDNDDIQSFLISMSIPKKKKYEKARTEEHSGKEDSSSDESEDEIAGSLTDKHNVLDANTYVENELKDFINEIPSQVNDVRNVDVDEQVYEKVFRQKEVPVVVEKGDDFTQKIGFASMRKVTDQPVDVHVVQNDLDLQEFQRLFVRKKNIKFEKMRTDEQSDKDETDSSSSDSDTDVVIPQVVPFRKNSSDEEFEKLNEELKQNLNIQEVMIDEEMVLDKNNHKGRPSQNVEMKDNSSNLMFSNMAKLDSLSPTSTNDSVDSESRDNDDIQSFLISMSIPKKMKYEKARTEEHSDKEDSSSDESEDEIAVSLDMLKDTPNGHTAKVQNEEENMDAIFREFEQKEEEETDSIGEMSDDDDVIQPFVSVAGEILLGFKYDHRESTFEVQVHKAKDLIAVDHRKNTTDPYVKVYLLPDTKRGGKRKTKAKRHSLNPDFDEVLDFKIPFEELVTRTCSVSVWHNDSFDKNLHLGEVNINIQEYINSGFMLDEPSPQWYTLCAKKVIEKAVTFLGDITIMLNYKAPGSQVAGTKKEQKKLPNPTKGSLEVTVKRANNLPSVNGEHGSNPFCKVILLSDSVKFPKFKTPVVTATTKPIWDSCFEFQNVSWTELQECVLQLAIFDYERGSANVFLAGTRLGLGKLKGIQHDSFGEEIDVWQSVLDNPNETKEYNIPLRSTLDSMKIKKNFAPAVHVKFISEEEHASIKKKSIKDVDNQKSFSKRLLPADTMSLASTGSVLSIYSMAGGEHGQVPITGEIFLSLKHDTSSGIFSLTIIKAKGLAAVNSKQQTSDPYVKVYMLPDKTKSTKKKTTFRRKTLDPQWNETIKYKYNREELLKKTLQVSVWNHDRFGRNDFLGEVQVNMKHYASKNDLEKEESVWYTLQEAAPVSAGGASDNKGELVIAVKYDHDMLSVQIKEAHGLTAVDPENAPSPFVKCFLLPDKSRKSKRKSSVQKKTVQPVWNEKFDYKNIQVSELQSRVLEVTVWDYHSSGHQFLGGLRLGLSQGDEYWHDCFNKEVSIWEAMIKHLGIFAEYTIPLRATMTSRKGQEPVDIPMITKAFDGSEDVRNEVFCAGLPCMRLALKYLNYETLDEDERKKKKAKFGELKVHLREARHLSTKPDGDLPSTFCKIYLYPKKKNAKFKTETYIKSTEPIWDTEKSFEGLQLADLRMKALEIEVYDEISEKKGNMIGLVRLGSGGNIETWMDSTGMEVEIWNSMLNNPNQWNEQMVPIRAIAVPVPKVEEIPVKEKKEVVKEDKKKPAEKELDDSDEENEAHIKENDGSESPRTSALRAMGVHAAGVIDLMQGRDAEQQAVYNPPQESLSPICEENELESSGPHKIVADVYEPTSSVAAGGPAVVPDITVTSEIRHGDPNFDITETDDTFEDEYPIKKKQFPAMSLLKRSTSRESLTSVYSTDSANIYGHVPVRGDVQFGMKYDATLNVFEVHVFQARDIAAVDVKKQQSDPYCKAYLLPDKTKYSKKKTKTRKKTLNPEWEEILEYKISKRDLRTRTLWLALWHLERFGRNIFLGEVMLNMDDIVDDPKQLETPTPKWYTLCEKGTPPMTELYKGEMTIGLMFEDPSVYSMRKDNVNEDSDKKKKKKKKKEKSNLPGKIHIHIKEAIDLPAADKDGSSDPFCKCYLLPLKSNKTKRKTPVIKSTLNPVWDYKTEYEVDYEDLADSGIEFTVWDWDRGKTNDFLGCIRINLGMRRGNWDDAEGVEISAWQHLIDNPNKWEDFVVPLRSKVDTRPNRL